MDTFLLTWTPSAEPSLPPAETPATPPQDPADGSGAVLTGLPLPSGTAGGRPEDSVTMAVPCRWPDCKGQLPSGDTFCEDNRNCVN